MHNITFRQITRKDFKSVHGLALKEWYYAYSHLRKKYLKNLVDKYYSEKDLGHSFNDVKKGKQFFVLACRGNMVVGFCNLILRRDKCELLRLYIDPKLIGKGLGKKLLLLGKAYVKHNKRSKYFTLVNRHNKVGVNFYLRNGFKHLPEKDRNDEFEAKVLWYMHKEL